MEEPKHKGLNNRLHLVGIVELYYSFIDVFAALSATVVAGAYAAKSSENDAFAIAAAKIGLVQAVSTAEAHVGGKAAPASRRQSASAC